MHFPRTGRFSETGYRVTQLDVEKTKQQLRQLIDKNALVMERRILRLQGKDIQVFDRDLEIHGDWERFRMIPPKVPNVEFESVIWFYGNASQEPKFRKLIGHSSFTEAKAIHAK